MKRIATAAALTVCLLGNQAFAQSESVRTEARERFDRGLRLFNAQDNEGAYAEFKRAFELIPHPTVLYNLGLVLAARQRPVEAVAAFDRLLTSSKGLSDQELTRAKATREEQLARIAELELVSSVAGTVFEVDGVAIGKSPLAAPVKVTSGSHVVAAIAPSHAPIRREVTLAGQTKAVERFDLLPSVEGLGQLKIESRPEGVEVTVDGQRVGKTPLPASIALAAGERVITLSRPGYASVERRLVVGPGSTGALSLELAVDPVSLAANGGYLALKISEPEAVVFVNGAPQGANTRPLRLPPGRHEIRVERADFYPARRSVEVPSGGTTNVLVLLEPTPEKRASFVSSARRQRTLGYVTGGVGAALAISGVVFLVLNSAEEADKKSAFDAEAAKQSEGGECDKFAGRQTKACVRGLEIALSELETVRKREVFGWVGLGVGGAALAGGVALLLTADDPAKYEPSSESNVFGRLELDVSVSPQGGFVGVASHF